LRKQHVAFNRPAHRGYAGDLVYSRPTHREVEPFVAADITVEHFANMKTEINMCDW